MTADAPWLSSYDPQVAAKLEYPQVPLSMALAETAHRHPDHPALVFKGRSILYEEYNRVVDRLAAALQTIGVCKGDRVAIHLPICPQCPFAFFAALRIGAVVVPCNPLSTRRSSISAREASAV